jgi:hypothetical protein
LAATLVIGVSAGPIDDSFALAASVHAAKTNGGAGLCAVGGPLCVARVVAPKSAGAVTIALSIFCI